MKIFLTGGTGFIGKNLHESLRYLHRIYQYKRGCDVMDELTDFAPDVIIHSAAEIYDEEKMVESNILLTYAILMYCSKHTDVKLIYIGSSSEYGKTTSKMSESDLCVPENLYAATKLCGTVLCQAIPKEYGFDCSVIRPFSVYGLHEPSHRLIPKLFHHAINDTGDEIRIINGNHDFFYIVDFCRYFCLLLNDLNRHNGSVFNFGYGEQRSNAEVVSVIQNITNKKLNIKYINDRNAHDSEYWVCDNSLLYTTFFERPKYNLEDGLCDWYEKNEKNG